MWTFISDFSQHSMEFVDVINADMTRRFVLRPFNRTHVSDVALSGTQIFCLSRSIYRKKHDDHITELAVFDIETGEEIKRTQLNFQAYTVTYLPQNNLLAIQFMDRFLHFLDAGSLRIIWQPEPLYSPALRKKWWFWGPAHAHSYKEIPSKTRPYPPGCAYVGSRLFEDTDGVIQGLAASDSGDSRHNEITGTSAGVFSFDVTTKEHVFDLVEFSAWGANELFAPSPNGKYAFRLSPQRELGPHFDAGHDPEKYLWMVEHQSLDLWSLADRTPLRRLHVSDMPVRVYVGQGRANKEAELRSAAKWTSRGRDRFRLPQSKPPGIKSLNKGFAHGSLYPNQSLKKVYWEYDSQAFWVARRGSLRRMSIDGTRGPLLFFDRYLNDASRAVLHKRSAGTDIGVGEVYPDNDMPMIKSVRSSETDVQFNFYGEILTIPRKVAMSDEPVLIVQDEMITFRSKPPLKAADIARMIPGLVRFKSWKETDIETGLVQLAHTIENDLSSLTANGISLVFQIGSSFMDEKQFITKLEEKDVNAASSVRSVIDAWCASLREHSVTYAGNEEGAGPLAYFLEHLAQRDDFCADQIRFYCTQRNGEHESYSRDTVLKGYLQRLGLVRSDIWQLAILYALLFRRDGRYVVEEGKQVSDWIHTGLLDKARAEVQPQAFAQMVQDELAFFESQSDVFAAFGTHKNAAEEAKQDLCDQLGKSQWDTALYAALSGEN